jgi:tetratricopeptide (TPR) repeat protein
LALKRMLGDSLGIAVAFNSLGMVAWRQGDVERARSLLEESLARSRALRARHVTAWALADFARIAASQGDAEQATKLLEESLAICREIGEQTDIAWCLGELGSVATIQGLAQRAARLFGAMEAMHEAMGVVLSPVDRADYERAVVVARAQIDESMWAAAWAEGQAMSLDQVIAYALATADPG